VVVKYDGFFTLPRSGIEDSREFPSSQIPGKSFGFLPSLSSLPPANPPKGGEAGVRQSLLFPLFRDPKALLVTERTGLGNRPYKVDFTG